MRRTRQTELPSTSSHKPHCSPLTQTTSAPHHVRTSPPLLPPHPQNSFSANSRNPAVPSTTHRLYPLPNSLVASACAVVNPGANASFRTSCVASAISSGRTSARSSLVERCRGNTVGACSTRWGGGDLMRCTDHLRG
jgi:hypothetical protein